MRVKVLLKVTIRKVPAIWNSESSVIREMTWRRLIDRLLSEDLSFVFQEKNHFFHRRKTIVLYKENFSCTSGTNYYNCCNHLLIWRGGRLRCKSECRQSGLQLCTFYCPPLLANFAEIKSFISAVSAVCVYMRFFNKEDEFFELQECQSGHLQGRNAESLSNDSCYFQQSRWP